MTKEKPLTEDDLKYEGPARGFGESYEDYVIRRRDEQLKLKNRKKNNFIHMAKYIHTETPAEVEKRVLEEGLAIDKAIAEKKLTPENGEFMKTQIIKTPKTYRYGVGTRKGKLNNDNTKV